MGKTKQINDNTSFSLYHFKVALICLLWPHNPLKPDLLPEETMKTLMVFDFDHTVVDDNSDTWVIR